ncbi:MAG: hypothetical protein J3K34DRAFT_460858 [Monoraphidium minutum]|nr:MAG: hypothetical protein J3K34DRAFT_460858 [Monoraphidium minutum]
MAARTLRLAAMPALAALAALLPLAAAQRGKEVGCRDRFGPFIEGAAVDKSGNLYALDFQRDRGAAGRVDAQSGACAPAPTAQSGGAGLNGLRVLPDGSMLAAAPEQKRVLHIPRGGGAPRVFCGDGGMVAPNDLAISQKNGFVYVSGQAWAGDTKAGDGDIWLCRKAGAPAVRLAQLGRTNGIEVSADGKLLFVSEAFNKGGTPASNVIWRYPIQADGTLDAPRRALAFDFGAAEGKGHIDVDGMRLDAGGRLYVTRHGGGEVVVINPLATNKVTRRHPLPFSAPTNVELGGPQGRTLFAVGRCGVGTPWGTGAGCVEAVQVDTPGLAWKGLQQGLPKVQLA